VNIGAYDGGLTPLLETLLAHTARIAFRLSSLHPTAIDDAFCRIAAHPRVRPHFHLSVQSGSDAVLRAMERPYPACRTDDAVRALRAVKDRPFIACDLIAGFPGETAADFAATLEQAGRCAFTGIHAFPFSPRPGTKAFALPQSVPQSEAGRRVAALEALAVTNKTAYVKSFIGTVLPAIRERATCHAVTANFIHVDLDGGPSQSTSPAGEVMVTVTEVLEDSIRQGGEMEARGALA
jgi:threonylcarbamoyladenosine tRNA methylthiotransferase MtaB